MNHGTLQTALLAFASWLGFVASIAFSHVATLASIAAAIAAIWASRWAIRVAKETISVRKAERAAVVSRLCADCIAGRAIPDICPLEVHLHPANCPRHPKTRIPV